MKPVHHLLLVVLLIAVLFTVPVHPQGGITVRALIYVSADPTGACTNGQASQYNYVDNVLWGCSGSVWTTIAGGGATGTVSNIATSAPITGGPITTTGTIACATCTVTVCSGSINIGSTTVASGAHSDFTSTCTGLATTDNLMVDFNASPIAVAGFIPSGTNGILTIYKWPTSNTVNVSLVNNTSGSFTTGTMTLNYRVTR
jgi:hypothetical protein